MRRPSPGLLVAAIGLIGASYAVTQLPRDSVGAKQLEENAGTAAKIGIGAVSGSKLSPSAFGSQRGCCAIASCVAR